MRLSAGLTCLLPCLSRRGDSKGECDNENADVEEDVDDSTQVGPVPKPFHWAEDLCVHKEKGNLDEWPNNRSRPIQEES